MTAFVALLSLAAFTVALWAVGIVAAAARALAISRAALASLRDQAADELEREQAVQVAALRLLGLACSILGRSALAAAVGYLPIWTCDAVGAAPKAAVLNFLARLDVMTIVSLALIAGYLIAKRLWPSRHPTRS